MNLAAFSIEQIKTLHNTALSAARTAAENTKAYREEIERRQPNYHGESIGNIDKALDALFTARTFANTPHDLAASDNPYRSTIPF